MKEYFQNLRMFLRPDLPFRINYVGESFCDETFLIERDSYEEYSLEYILEGEGFLEINGQLLVPKEGDVFLLDKHSKHRYYCTKTNPWHKVFICFNGHMADVFVRTYLKRATYLYQCEAAKEIFLNMYHIATSDISDYKEKHTLILHELMKVFIVISENTAVEPDGLAEKVKRILDNNLQAPYKIKTLSEKLHYSNNHIINIFAEKFGITPYQYYTKQKIALAKEYLTHTQMSVTEIAERLCYTDDGYFSVCFKKQVGMTPSQYKKALRER